MSVIIWLCAICGLAIFGVMLHSIATFRSDTAHLRRHVLSELGWALIPILIMIAAAAPSMRADRPTHVAASD